MNVATSGIYLLIILFYAYSFVSCAYGPAPGNIEKPKGANTVSFKSSEDGIIGGALNLTGRLNKPEGDGPFPAVVLLHGCGGIQPKRDHRWAERLSGWGYVTLQADSFRPRGLSSVCTYSGTDSVDIVQKRVEDAYDARRYLAGLPFVDKTRIAVMGWSHGGMTTLQTLYRKTDDPFRAAIAFYPSCRRTLAGLNAPLLILIGEVDDWSSAGRCMSAMPKDKTASEVILKVYPGAYHGFDRMGANADVRGATGMHHLQYQPEAEADSIIRVKTFFEKHLKEVKRS
jgi:dienelactone hydrolase